MTPEPLNILAVSQFYDSHRGGLEIVAGQLAREWTERGHEVRWIASGATPPPPALADRGRASPLKVWNWTEDRLGIPFPLPGPSAIRTLWRDVRQAGTVVVHDSLYPTSVLAFLFARLHRKPFAVIQHIGHIAYRNRVLSGLMAIANRCVARPLLARADQVFFISHNTADYFATVAFRAPPQIVFNGVDTSVFVPASPGERATARAAHGLDPQQPVALFVGRFVEKKGLLAIKQMATAMPDVTFLLAGWGPIDPKSWALPNVRVLDGLSNAGLVPFYQMSDALVLPSFGEGLPLVVQEATACGLPVLCGEDSLAGDPEAGRFVTGLRVDPADTAATAAIFQAAFERVLARTHDDSCDRAAFARDRYDWQASANRYLQVLGTLRASGRPRAARRTDATTRGAHV